jgi:hypothetical protein
MNKARRTRPAEASIKISEILMALSVFVVIPFSTQRKSHFLRAHSVTSTKVPHFADYLSSSSNEDACHQGRESRLGCFRIVIGEPEAYDVADPS